MESKQAKSLSKRYSTFPRILKWNEAFWPQKKKKKKRKKKGQQLTEGSSSRLATDRNQNSLLPLLLSHYSTIFPLCTPRTEKKIYNQGILFHFLLSSSLSFDVLTFDHYIVFWWKERKWKALGKNQSYLSYISVSILSTLFWGTIWPWDFPATAFYLFLRLN